MAMATLLENKFWAIDKPAGGDCSLPDATNHLYVGDISTGEWQKVGNLGYSVISISASPATGKLYGSTRGKSASCPSGVYSNYLFEINPDTGEASPAFKMFEPADEAVASIGFTPSGDKLFGYSEEHEGMTNINIAEEYAQHVPHNPNQPLPDSRAHGVCSYDEQDMILVSTGLDIWFTGTNGAYNEVQPNVQSQMFADQPGLDWWNALNTQLNVTARGNCDTNGIYTGTANIKNEQNLRRRDCAFLQFDAPSMLQWEGYDLNQGSRYAESLTCYALPANDTAGDALPWFHFITPVYKPPLDAGSHFGLAAALLPLLLSFMTFLRH